MAFYQNNQFQAQPQNLQFYPTQYDQFQNFGNINNNPIQGSMDSTYASNYDVSGSMGDQTLSTGILAAFSTSGYSNEPPLLEELGINFNHIKLKTQAVLNPRGKITPDIMIDSDLAGPLLFCLIFGTFLLLAGKVHFGYIYGVALFGTIALHFFFKLMSENSIDFTRTASVLGYCLLPLVPISFAGIFLDLNNLFGYALSAFTIFWSTFSASGFFIAVLKLDNVRPLIAYPLAMFYSVFVLMAIFVEKTE
ncbi:putative membrane protein [Wickerhamomyces ciferrii]|uniref:Protein YIP n=1 Tax=Wickerhamomyces ciferrii (strain ATCC 14091 / BCRC 22168 / CBS 111 / JCM 3599 / NBRC 0793 / NRRL Y-1031 F-60-10) TaxID=1206466 RepID=K0KJI1_WICCF|nr:uncharacterized protein BN7_1190 [Wickerhamomyces ciferrii]CCH41649.1 putative membrane protein [Wickerhamomyces ciferrii]